MRVLLDECLPKRLRRELVDHFDIFLTADRNLSYQQDVSSFNIAIVVLVARSNRLEELRPLVTRLLEVLPTAARRAVTFVRR